MLNQKLIEALLSVAQTGSITKSAELLYTSQPALSRLIRDHERRLGVDLFDRRKMPLQLTFAGKRYIDACIRALNIQRSVQDEISEIRRGEIGEVTLGLSTYMSRCISHIVFPKHYSEFPNVKLKLVEKSASYLEDIVLSGGADFAIVYNSSHPDLSYSYITSETLYLLIPPSYARKHGFHLGFNDVQIELEEIRDQPFVLLKQGHGLRVTADTIFAQKHIKPMIRVETDDLSVAHQLVNADIGFSFVVPTYLNFQKFSQSGIFCNLRDFSGNRNIYLCHHSEHHITRPMRSLMVTVSEALKTHYPH
ncbi:MAG: LysR family transcriptional regulator [Bacillota bacterium]|nr:LysR family transcriptional regulator [Bacillota bacterium]